MGSARCGQWKRQKKEGSEEGEAGCNGRPAPDPARGSCIPSYRHDALAAAAKRIPGVGNE